MVTDVFRLGSVRGAIEEIDPVYISIIVTHSREG